MAIVKMQKISICAHKSNRKAVLETLQSMGVMQLATEELDDQELMRMDTAEARSNFLKNADLADQALAVLNQYAPENKGFAASLAGKTEISRADYSKSVGEHKKTMAVVRQILKEEKAISECKGIIQNDENQIGALTPWLGLDVPMTFQGTYKTAAFIGSVPGTVDEAQIYALIRDKAPELDTVSCDVLSSQNDATNISVLCLDKDREKVETALRAGGFSRPAQAVSSVPAEAKEELEKDIEAQKKQISQLGAAIASKAAKRRDMEIASDFYRTRAEKYRMLGTIPQSKRVFFIEGWVPAEAADRLAKVMTERFGAVVGLEEIREDESAPTALTNNKFSSNFEGVLASYGLPAQGKADPTFIMSLFYFFFFGMMLSDAGYGLLMVIGCFIAVRKFPKMEEGMKKFLNMFFWCGVSTTFWGFMFGGFFGDVIDVVAKTFFGYTGATPILKPLWFNPLEQPMQLLIWCLLFGVIHLFAGLGIKGYEYLKQGDAVGFVSDIVAWYTFLLGLILMLLPSDIFAGISGMTFHFPGWLNGLARIITIAGLVIILLMSGRANKNWGLRIALGAYDIYGVTSWLSDVLSYSRLLALGLATGVIAQVINMMGSMGGRSVIGAIVFILVFIVGTALNMAINVLGAYVHTNRLQYVEFFGKFYEGGGEAFSPFKTANQYIEIKEDN